MKQNEVKSEEEVSLSSESGLETELPKVAVFLDVPNIYMSSKKNNERYEPAKVIAKAEQLGRITHAFAYTRLSLSNNGMPGWISKYRGLGFELKFIYDLNKGSEQKDIDTHLVTDALETAYTTEVQIFVIASGDGDYIPLVHLLREMGKQIVVMGVNGSVSRFLSAVANETIFLDGKEDDNSSSLETGDLEEKRHAYPVQEIETYDSQAQEILSTASLIRNRGNVDVDKRQKEYRTEKQSKRSSLRPSKGKGEHPESNVNIGGGA